MNALKRIHSILFAFLAGFIIATSAFFISMSVTEGRAFDRILRLNTFSEGAEPISTEAPDSALVQYAYAVLRQIKDSDYKGLSTVVHPEYGVVFSPYSTVTLATDKYFTASQVAKFDRDSTVYVWGVYDGSGEPIEMTPADYFERFVFDRDYTQAEKIGVDQVVRTGNALENITEAFPNVRYVDFYLSGGQKAEEELAWGSLRLGFEEYEGFLRLTVIIHSEYTV